MVKISEMEEESKSGQMALDMMDSGKKEWLMVEEDWYTPTVMCTSVSGNMIRLTGMEFNKTIMEVDTKANGLMINNMATVPKPGRMVQLMWVNTLTA
jgi:hypothetical protein